MDGDRALFFDQFDFDWISLSVLLLGGDFCIDCSGISVRGDCCVATGFYGHQGSVKSFLIVKRSVFHPCLINPVEGPDPLLCVILLTFWDGGGFGGLFLRLDTQLGTRKGEQTQNYNNNAQIV